MKPIHSLKTIKINSHLIVIREKLNDIDPRLLTEYTNIYLILGTHSALLLDTGSGLCSIKEAIRHYIEDRKLIVLNTHSDWDHVGGNFEFQKIFIHELEKKRISNTLDISILKSSPKSIVKKFESNDFKIKPASSIEGLKEGDKIDLGNIQVKVFQTPGHSVGSISLLSSRGELFTGDTAHYGTVYLPEKGDIVEFISSLERLIRLSNIDTKIFPSHEQYDVDNNLLTDLLEKVISIDRNWDKRKYNDFLKSWIINDNPFKLIVPKS
ncbi:MAG: MBL fold metallo-hydrolase [Promethearchaeota archaeon]